MGLIGIPSVGEEITVQRDIQLVAYTRSRLHFHAISAAASIPLIQKAKGDKLSVTCDAVSYTHLRAHETVLDLVCRLLLEKKKKKIHTNTYNVSDTRINI